MKILFILKTRHGYDLDAQPIDKTSSSGLGNSVRFVVEMLRNQKLDVVAETVNDNNDIDRVVDQHRPTHVIIEALWVTPAKFGVLKALHPDVEWIVRLHSNAPFLAQEGTAMDWIQGYINRGVIVAANHRRLFEELRHLHRQHGDDIWLLPNYYPIKDGHPIFSPKVRDFKRELGCHDPVVDIGCFGAIRPLKNHLAQAIAAIRYADENLAHLNFHINTSRLERQGEPILTNLRSLFGTTRHHSLVEHNWLDHDDFLDLVATMDAVMQVSFSETFNIVTADAVSQGVPVVTSDSIDWVSPAFHADPTDSGNIKDKLYRGLGSTHGPWLNQRRLREYDRASEKLWLSHLCVPLRTKSVSFSFAVT